MSVDERGAAPLAGLPATGRQEEVVHARESGDLEEGRFGWFEIDSVSRDGEAVVFRETNTGVFTTGGLAYLPDGRRPRTPENDERSEYRHLGGPWYVWTSGW